MFNVWLLALWFCSIDGLTRWHWAGIWQLCICQMFFDCALSLPLWRITRRCERDTSPLQWNIWVFLLGTGSRRNDPVLAALGSRCWESCFMCCGRQGAADVLVWIMIYESIFFVYVQVLLGHWIQIHHAHNQFLLEYEYFFPQSWDLSYGNHKH